MRASRDTVVEYGMRAKNKSELSAHQKGPWLYKAKVKSGRRATLNVEDQYTNILHLMGDMVVKHARDNEDISVYAIKRIMKANLRSIREDI